MGDGDDVRRTGIWTEAAGTYNTGAADAANAKINHGRIAHSGNAVGGRGICPENWHVPTNYEWGVFFDMVEGGGTEHQKASENSWVGTNAGKYSKSVCNGSATDSAPLWVDSANRGTDTYGFRVLPTGYRYYDGSGYLYRGSYAYFWSSSAYDSTYAWYRLLLNDHATVFNNAHHRADGFSVRCIKDL
jgi:uncharacterized protein (TIGR02145 family)